MEVAHRAAGTAVGLESGKRKQSRDLARTGEINPQITARPSYAPLQLALEEDIHVIGVVAFVEQDLARLGPDFFRLPDEPFELIFGQVREYFDGPQILCRNHLSTTPPDNCGRTESRSNFRRPQ